MWNSALHPTVPCWFMFEATYWKTKTLLPSFPEMGNLLVYFWFTDEPGANLLNRGVPQISLGSSTRAENQSHQGGQGCIRQCYLLNIIKLVAKWKWIWATGQKGKEYYGKGKSTDFLSSSSTSKHGVRKLMQGFSRRQRWDRGSLGQGELGTASAAGLLCGL